jgi:hypothetical protein
VDPYWKELNMSGESCSCGGNCGCGSHQQAEIYLTREEYVQRLEQYLVDLKAEMEAVEAELSSLRVTA